MNTFIRPKTETDRQADRYIQMKTLCHTPARTQHCFRHRTTER